MDGFDAVLRAVNGIKYLLLGSDTDRTTGVEEKGGLHELTPVTDCILIIYVSTRYIKEV